MIRFLTTLLLLLPLALGAEVYRYVDESGKVHYSDTPPDANAKPIEVRKAQSFSAPNYDEPAVGGEPPAASSEPAEKPITVQIISPANSETLRYPDPYVLVNSSVSPGVPEGGGLVFYHNGRRVNAEPTTTSGVRVEEVHRGEHTFVVAVVDAAGAEKARSAPVVVYKKPPKPGG